MSYGNIGDGVVALFKFLLILCTLFVPLGLWKLIELICLLITHVKWVP